MLSNVPSLSHRIHSAVSLRDGVVREGESGIHLDWLSSGPRDLWPQLHVATPRCSWRDVINSIKDCENPLNTPRTAHRGSSHPPPTHPTPPPPSLLDDAVEERWIPMQPSLRRRENPNASLFSTAYHFHLSCSGDAVTHAPSDVCTDAHIPVGSASLSHCSQPGRI